jgi:hypothetical protein
MTFQLIQGSEFSNSTLSEADIVCDLDFSQLHHCDMWSIWCNARCIAHVMWPPSAKYCVGNDFDGAEIIVPREKIIPTVKGVINYNQLFKLYAMCYCYPIEAG